MTTERDEAVRVLAELASILDNRKTTTDSGLPVTVAECMDVMQAAASEIRQAIATLTAQRGEVAGEWVTVPRNPTAAMAEAGANADPERESVWAAMLSVAPTPPATQQAEAQAVAWAVWLMPVATDPPGNSRLLQYAWGRSDLSTGQMAHAYQCIVSAAQECGQTFKPTTPPKPTEATAVPEHVRRLIGRIDQFRLCMSYNESYFGEPTGLLKGVFAELGTAVNPIYPDGTTALYPNSKPASKEGG